MSNEKPEIISVMSGRGKFYPAGLPVEEVKCGKCQKNWKWIEEYYSFRQDCDCNCRRSSELENNL